jgi:hypothetical protein
MQVERGQYWKNKTTGKTVKILRKATGNRHWTIDNGHHIHEGTLIKFYEYICK